MKLPAVIGHLSEVIARPDVVAKVPIYGLRRMMINNVDTLQVHREYLGELVWTNQSPGDVEVLEKSRHGLAVGDVVSFTNDYGVVFSPYTVLYFATPEQTLLGGNDVFLSFKDSWWFPVKASSLMKI